MKKNCPEQSGIHHKKPLVRGMSLKNLEALMETLRDLHGEGADNITFLEVVTRYPQLVAHFDEGRRVSPDGQEITDEQMFAVEQFLEIGTTVRDAREKVLKARGTKVA